MLQKKLQLLYTSAAFFLRRSHMITSLREFVQAGADQLLQHPDAIPNPQLHQALHQLNHHLETAALPPYRACLHTLIIGGEFEESKITKEREEIKQSFTAMGPLLGSCKWSEKMQLLFERHFCADCFRLFDELKNNHDIIALQGLLGKTLPLKRLCEAALSQEAPLAEFVSLLSEKKVPVDLLHNGLKGIIEVAQRRHPSLNYDLGALEEMLQQHWERMLERGEAKNEGWSLFETSDSLMLASHSRLQPGSRVKARMGDGKLHEFTLGQPLGALHPDDRNRFFHICRYAIAAPSASPMDNLFEKMHRGVEQKGIDSSLIWFPCNAAMPGYLRRRSMRQLAEEIDHCVPLNCPTFIDPRGRFCLVEKLHSGLGSAAWFHSLALYLPTAIAWMKWLGETSITPSAFKAEYLAFNREQRLTAVKEMKSLSYNVLSMELFAWTIGGGNPQLFREILEEANLAQHPYARFIREAVLLDLNPERIRSKAVAESIPEYVQESALATLQALRQVKAECLETLQKTRGNTLLLDQRVVHEYQESGGSALILSDFIKSKVCQKLTPA